jgi:hypothetical protein
MSFSCEVQRYTHSSHQTRTSTAGLMRPKRNSSGGCERKQRSKKAAELNTQAYHRLTDTAPLLVLAGTICERR